MKFFEIIAILIFTVVGIIILFNYSKFFLAGQSDNEKIFYKKEDFLFSINNLVGSCLSKESKKQEVCYFITYKGKEDILSEEVLSRLNPKFRESVTINFDTIATNEKVSLIFVPPYNVSIVKYSQIEK